MAALDSSADAVADGRGVLLCDQERSEREPRLKFQTAVVGIFRKALAICPAGHLICQAEERRRNVSDDRPGVGVVQNVAEGHGDHHVVAAVAGSREDTGDSTWRTLP